jgi:hypothetical protein
MIHIKEDSAQTLCGLTLLPDGHVWFFAGEHGARKATCPKCNPEGPQPIGTPISQLSGHPGQPGFSRFSEIALTWGHP